MDFYRRAVICSLLILAIAAVSTAQAQTDSSSVSTATSSRLVITRTLTVGATGDDVSELQQFLKNEGYFTYPTITGYYGAATWQAVADFQEAHGLEGVGYVGPQTRALIDSLSSGESLQSTTTPAANASPTVSLTRSLSQGDSGDDVSALQQFLEQQRFYTYPTITGYFGTVTQMAVEAFQKANHIDPIGIVGPQTRAAIAILAGGSRVASNTSTVSPNPAPSVPISIPSIPGGYTPGFGGGGGQVSSNIANSTPATRDTTPPTTPTNLSAKSVSSTEIDLSWTASTDNVGVTGYIIFRDGVQIATTNTTSYADIGVEPSDNYTYTVEAYDAAGNVSAASGSASATTLSFSGDLGDAANTINPLGMNGNGISYSTGEQPFLNVFKQAAPWAGNLVGTTTRDSASQGAIELDANGYPISMQGTGPATGQTFTELDTLIWQNTPYPYYPSGQYVVSYDGTGTINYYYDATKVTASSTPGRDVFNVATATGAGVKLAIDSTGTSSTVSFSGSTVSWPSSNFTAGTPIVFQNSGGALPSPLVAGTLYYILSSGLGANSFEIATSVGGTPISFSGGSGTQTAFANWIRNIRVVQAQYESLLDSGEVFDPAYVTFMKPFSTIRFMAWANTNSATAYSGSIAYAINSGNWSDRTLPSNATWTVANGVPIETEVALLNETGANGWFNMPITASDDYITQYAILVHDTLNPPQEAYIEYSNEVWNFGFSQIGYAEQQGEALWPTALTNGYSAYTIGLDWYAMRASQMCEIWKSVWGSDAGRVNCILGSQAANTSVTNTELACSLWSSAPCSTNHGINAIAIAPYFGYSVPDSWASDPNGLNDLFTEIDQGGLAPGGYAGGMIAQAVAWTTAQKAIANAYGLALVAYESGQSLVNQNDATTSQLYIEANEDPRMGSSTLSYLRQQSAAGLQLINYFSNIGGYSIYGSWGAVQDLYSTTTPKYEALLDFIPPLISITSPSSGAILSNTVTLTASSTAINGVSTIQFEVDGANVGSACSSSPCSVSWNTNTVDNIAHTISAVALDDEGNYATSTINVTVRNIDTTPPLATLVSPPNGATLQGVVTLTATSSDNKGVASVQFLVDGTDYGIASSTSPYSPSWDTTTVSNGTHTVAVLVTDTSGNQTTASSTVTVENPVIVFLTSGTTWTVPANWNSASNTIEAIGGGAGGANAAGAGGGGGEYREITDVSYSPRNVINIQIGQGGMASTSGTATFIDNDANSAILLQANGGSASTDRKTGGAGGTGGIGGSGNQGGAGGNSTMYGSGSGGGGGAGGPDGVGGAGGASPGNTGGAGGGGNGGGSAGTNSSSTSGAAGGNNNLGSGGGSGGILSGSNGQAGSAGTAGGGGGGGSYALATSTAPGGAGSMGTEWYSSHGTEGSGGGGGGGGGNGTQVGDAGGAGGLYGGGGGGGAYGGSTNGSGGAGAQGIIVITYYP